MERCSEHKVVDGQVERSMKKGAVVERTRRCGQCGSLFKTREITEDLEAHWKRERDVVIQDLKRELEFYGQVFTDTKEIFEAVKMLNDDLRRDFEFGNEDRD